MPFSTVVVVRILCDFLNLRSIASTVHRMLELSLLTLTLYTEQDVVGDMKESDFSHMKFCFISLSTLMHYYIFYC